MIRPARQSDRDAVEAIVGAAYSIYVERIGKPPAPMLDDYEWRIAEDAVYVLESAGGAIAAIVVLLPRADHLLLDNVAVRPDRQSQGFARKADRIRRGRSGASRIRRVAPLYA
jgi:N-acetylglutamate synthase-like GNAT family acetyltransferase